MSRHLRPLIAGAILSAVILLSLSAQVATRPGRGEEWLSWSAAQRRIFVGAYLQGYEMGKLDACNAAGDLFDQHKRVRDPDDLPERKCFRHAKGYFGSADDYAVLLTAFYSKHSEHRDIPVDYFMLLFTDGRFQTLGGIEEGMRKGEVRTNF